MGKNFLKSKQDLFSSYLSLRLVSLSSLVSRFPAIAPAYSRSPSNFATGHHLLARRLRILEVGSTDQFRWVVCVYHSPFASYPPKSSEPVIDLCFSNGEIPPVVEYAVHTRWGEKNHLDSSSHSNCHHWEYVDDLTDVFISNSTLSAVNFRVLWSCDVCRKLNFAGMCLDCQNILIFLSEAAHPEYPSSPLRCHPEFLRGKIIFLFRYIHNAASLFQKKKIINGAHWHHIFLGIFLGLGSEVQNWRWSSSGAHWGTYLFSHHGDPFLTTFVQSSEHFTLFCQKGGIIFYTRNNDKVQG